MKLLRLMRIAPIALLFAGVASAQTTGTIIGVVTDAQSGKPVAGALVTATSPTMQGEQTVVTDKAGNFRLTLLPPGDFKLAVSFEGYKPAERADITLRVDKTIRANLAIIPEAVQMEEQVVKTGTAAPVVNVGTAETGTVVSKEFLSNIPVGRGFEQVAAVAPTAQTDTYGISFAGASSPENGYILDGMNVTDPQLGTLGAEIVNNFVQEIDVKTGSFMPEYGFATGGIINVVTKSGSNEFHGSVFGNWQPGQLQPDPKAVGRVSEALSLRNLPKEGSYRADFGFDLGGPIMKDRLWFYVGVAPVLRRTVQERVITAFPSAGDPVEVGTRRFSDLTQSYNVTGKLTYLFNENNNLTVTGFFVPESRDGGVTGSNGTPSSRRFNTVNDFADVIARYSSKLLDKKLLLEVTAGWHNQVQNDKAVTSDGVDGGATSQTQWTDTWNLGDLEALSTSAATACAVDPVTGYDPCPVTNYTSGGSGYVEDITMNRYAVKAAATYLASAGGSHQIKAGVDIQRANFDHYVRYTGGQLIREIDIVAFNVGSVNSGAAGVVNSTNYPEHPLYFQDFRRYGTVSADRQSATNAPNGARSINSVSYNRAYFLQDSWSPEWVNGLTINAGLRWETQDMGVPGLEGSSSLKLNDGLGPRLQAIYDWTGQGRSKLAVNWGRFYSTFPMSMADRAFGDERQIRAYRDLCWVPGVDDKSTLAGAPQACAEVQGFFRSTTRGVYTYTPTGSGSTVVAPDIKAPFVDMFGATVEYEVLPDLSVGFDYTGRRTPRVIEDMSPDDGANYAIANPGEGKPFDIGDGTIFDPTTAQATDPVTGYAFTTPFPKPKRDYDGFTFSMRKNFSSHWLAQASYTYSSLRGNYSGMFRPETGQLNPGINSTFDLAGLLANQEGPLPGDTPHFFKASGSYTFDLGPRMGVSVGGQLNMRSGQPINYLVAHPDYGPAEAFGMPRGTAGRTPFLTTMDLRGVFSYTVTPPYNLKFSVDVFNLFNSQEATTVDENWTFDSAQVAVGAQCSSNNGAESKNPIAGALADCPALNYLKNTSGTPVTINSNFGRPTAYQVPLAIRFGLELSF